MLTIFRTRAVEAAKLTAMHTMHGLDIFRPSLKLERWVESASESADSCLGEVG